ncbi:MAG: Gfo/Idh/MocA family oxidoreductase [Atribacterota bacterium]|nr:Gfo/Idh/MocA family oxidoreductase [Atribacterota bacterium]
MTHFRVGIIGIGSMGLLHRQALTKLGVEVIAVMGRTREKGLMVAQQMGAIYCQSVPEMVKTGVNVVIVATPTASHAQILTELVEEGVKNIFCEKPLVNTLEEAQRIRKMCEKEGVRLGIGYKMRFEHGFQMMKEMVEQGIIGPLKFLTFNYFQTTPPQPWYLESGVLHEIFSHVIDLSNWFVVEAPLEVLCKTQNFQGGAREDRAYLTVHYSGGIVAAIHGGWLSEYPELPGKQKRNICFQLVGERGYIAGIRGLKLFLCRDDQEETIEVHPVDAVTEELRSFFDALKQNQFPPVGLREGFAVQAVIEAALQSAQNGRAEKILPGD